jgi:hypothetical protein
VRELRFEHEAIVLPCWAGEAPFKYIDGYQHFPVFEAEFVESNPRRTGNR